MCSLSGSNFILNKDILLEKLQENDNDAFKAANALREEIELKIPRSVIMLDEEIGHIAQLKTDGTYEYKISFEMVYSKLFS